MLLLSCMVLIMNGECLRNLSDCEVELNSIKDWIDSDKFHKNVRFLVNYAIVKSCGTIENIYKQIIFDKLSENVNDQNKSYLTKVLLNSSSNPSFGKIKGTLENVGGAFAANFDERLKNKNEKECINSLVGLRNTFSHGGTITSSIEDVIILFEGAKWVLLQLEDCINA